LQQIATEANGFYLPLQGANPMETLYERGLAPLPKNEETTRLTRVYRERYHWFLGFAVICLVVETLLPERARTRSRRARGAAALQTAAVALAFCLIPQRGSASPSSAFRDYQSGKFTNAFEEYNRLVQQKTNDYRLHYDAGAAAYQAKKLEAAEAQFNSALNTPDIISDPQNQQRTYYNLGNTHYRMGEPVTDTDKKKELWQEAITNFNFAVRLNTNDLDAKNNLAFVKQQLEQLNKQQDKDKNKQPPEDKEPSAAAKAAKARADEAIKRRQYRQALDIMEESLKNDPTTQNYEDYIKRLQEINGVAVPPHP
jgi:Ca-activated chloride channel family protein